MDDIENLEREIKILKKRIEILESKDNRRKISKNFKLIFKICLFLLFVYGIYYGYNYLTRNIPNMIEEKVKETIFLKK